MSTKAIGPIQEATQLIPGFEKFLVEMDPDQISEFFSKLKEALANWLNASSIPPSPPLISDDHLNRGIQHDLLGYYLCPITLDWNDILPRIRNKIWAGNDPDYTIGSTIISLKGMFLISRWLFKKSSPCKGFSSYLYFPGSARGIQLEQENDSDIGHFALSSAPSWTMEYEGFHYGDFYHFIVDYFEAVSGKQAKERLGTSYLVEPSVAAAPPMNALATSLYRLQWLGGGMNE
ncbi:hypothetical protein BDQ17DRAFT_1335344 [Cyathus striatus]|nr:hypothetical protein BDQ17DRAFT_1335344 [Cyathus striatus]